MDAILSGVQDMEIVGMVPTGEEAINVVRSNRPDVVLMDILMPGMTGIEAARWVKEIDSAIRVILVSMEVSKEYVSAAMKSGVDGFLPKDCSKRILIEAIRTVHKGEQYFTDAIRKLVLEDVYKADAVRNTRKTLPNQLTKREAEVLRLVASGKANREIGETLGISVKTVETHKTHILIKLGLNNNAELVRYAVKNKIIST